MTARFRIGWDLPPSEFAELPYRAGPRPREHGKHFFVVAAANDEAEELFARPGELTAALHAAAKEFARECLCDEAIDAFAARLRVLTGAEVVRGD